ncbi:MAG: type VI secretion system membrane subunit TssM [Alphaproteobacteria bacterium]|nr:type VI secretion system membrane subunit TssM [Alphaproteobacteria bacterium]
MSHRAIRLAAVFLLLVLFCLLFFFLSPYVSIAGAAIFAPVWLRLLIVALILLTWAGLEGYKWMRRGKRDKEMAEGLEHAAGDSRGGGARDDIQEINEKFRRALKMLRQRRFGGSRQRLYELPWYLMIGPPGSGKTTWIRNSGLRFPLAEVFGSDPVQGMGGTRTCDWWFTEEAVILDTAGRFSTQDSDPSVDSATWLGLLGALRRNRRRRPLDGVIVAMSVADLASQPPEKLIERGIKINRRLSEIAEKVGTTVPVYFVFTKTDLVAGFTEYFEDLTADEREQVWGETWPLDRSGDVPDMVGHSIDRLLGRLDERLVARLHAETDPQRDALIHGFPFQFASLKPAIRRFLGEVCRKGPYGDAAILARGVYFSSGTQEGDPFDRILQSVARDLGLPQPVQARARGSSRSFFIGRVLKDVIFREAGLVGNTGFLDRYRTWIQRLVIFGSAAIFLLTAVLLYVSYANNRQLLASLDAKAAGMTEQARAPLPPDAPLFGLLPTLNALRDFPAGFAREDEPTPAWHGLGLYQGDAYGATARDAYADALSGAFVPALMHDVEAVLRSDAEPGRRYQALKLYLMLADRDRFDPAYVTAASVGVLRQRYGALTPEAEAAIQAHAAALGDKRLAAALRPVALDKPLVEQVRRDLTDMDPAVQVYASLSQALADTDIPPWRLRDHVTAAERYFDTEGRQLSVPPLFTRKGYAELFMKQAPAAVHAAAGEGWVLGAGEGRPGAFDERRLLRDVTRLYFQDYRQSWNDLIGSLQLRVPPTQDLRPFVRRLADRDSPLREALKAIVAELDFAAPGADKAAAALKSKLGAAASFMPAGVGSHSDEMDPRKAVSAEFRDLIQLVGGPKPPLDGILDQLGQFSDSLRDMERTGDSGKFQDAVDTLRDDARGRPAPLDAWMLQLADIGHQAFVQDSGERVAGAWAAAADSRCASINGRFPFRPGAREDVNLADFADLFGYGGVLESFFNEHMKPYVDRSGGTWKWRDPSQAPDLPSGALGLFQQADEIRSAFFRQGAQEPKVEFQISSRSIDSRATNATLVLGGKTMVFRPNIPATYKLTWPFDPNDEASYLVFIRAGGGTTTPQEFQGPWSLFRLFAGNLRSGGSRDRFVLRLERDGLVAEFEVKALSVDNPFGLRLDRFRCPANL